jgi:parvulin-like peptidyl-prolyl isomerase
VPLVINGQSIEDGIIEAEFAQIKSYFEQMGNVSCCERDDEFRGYARDNVIARVLLLQESTRRIAALPAEEVDAAMAALEQSHGGQQALLADLGATPDQLDLVRNDVAADLRLRKMIDTVCAQETPPDDTSLRQYYQDHLDAFLTAEQVRASHILKTVRRSEDRQKAYEELRSVRQQLLAGADFETLAREHSDKAAEHIDFGFFKRGELPEEVEVVAFSSEVGEVSPIFLSTYGYHVIKVTDRKPPTPRPFDETQTEVRDRLIADRRAEVTRKLVEELKKSAKVEDQTPKVEAPVHVH